MIILSSLYFLLDFDDQQDSNSRSENGDETESGEIPAKKKVKYEIRLQPEGFTPPVRLKYSCQSI